MIIGHGNIASVLQEVDRQEILYFASGVSNSACTDEEQFKREEDLLLQMDRNKHLVYFSSLSVYRSDSEYNMHKRYMEAMVKDHFPYYTIVRIEVIAWGRNPTTIHNVFRRMLQDGNEPVIRDEKRYIITKDELQYWMRLIPLYTKNEMNIPGRIYSIQEIYDMVKAGEL